MKIKSISAVLCQIEDILLMACLAISFVVLLLQVITRYVFGYPLTWTEELARFLLIWITYFGVNFAIRNQCNINITIFTSRLPQKAQQLIQVLVNLVMVICIAVYLPYAVQYMLQQASIRSSLLKIPMSLVVLPAVLGFFISAVNLLLKTAAILKKLAGRGGDT